MAQDQIVSSSRHNNFHKILDLLKLPEVQGANLDAPETTLIHRQIILSKPLLKSLYVDFYRSFGQSCGDISSKVCVELGSGGGFIKEVYPTVITSDILKLSHVDCQFSVLSMPFKDNSIDGFFMKDVFHHISNPSLFLRELLRCLKKGGRVMMIEPSNTIFSQFAHRNFHHEPYDAKAGWCLQEGGPLSNSNLALPWIVFIRDRAIFERDFPEFCLDRIIPHTTFRYLLSGGVSMRQIVPSWSNGMIKALEWLASPFNPWLGILYTIELTKR